LMIDTPFTRFLHLAAFDQEINQLHARINSYDKEYRALEQQQHKASETLEAVKQAYRAAQKSVHDKETSLRTISNDQKTKQARKETAFSPKECQALEVEIETLHKKQELIEIELEHAWAQTETARTAYEQEDVRIRKLLATIDEEKKRIDAVKETTQTMLTEKTNMRPEKIAGVPEDWLKTYENMRLNVKDPVVPVVNGHCSGCFYKVTSQDLLSLGRNKLLACKDCYRLLFIDTK
jgi:predicted  nucleic acid-binding Zn-ribbon protein